jgi:hypothetical protein
MMRKLVLVSCLATLGGALVVSGGCTSSPLFPTMFLKGQILTYEQYLSVDQSATPAPTADMVLKKLGTPMEVRDRDGLIREIDYHAYSLNGDMKIATFFFDANQKLVKKDLW